MRATATACWTAALACSACGLFLDDLSKGSGGDSGTDTGIDTDTSDDFTPCEGVDLAVDVCCNLENSCNFDNDFFCDCPTCAWDASDCGVGDAGAPDGGGDTDTGTELPEGTPCDGVDLEETPCCNLENTCGFDNDLYCDCPTCEWDAADCA
jgi:hypothetical protein